MHQINVPEYIDDRSGFDPGQTRLLLQLTYSLHITLSKKGDTKKGATEH